MNDDRTRAKRLHVLSLQDVEGLFPPIDKDIDKAIREAKEEKAARFWDNTSS